MTTHRGREQPANGRGRRFASSRVLVRFPDGNSYDVIVFTCTDGEQTATHRIPAIIAERYVVEDILSDAGGQGVIFRAHDNRLAGRNCLVKANRYTKISLQRAAEGSPQEILDRRVGLERESRFLVTMQRRGEGRVPILLRHEEGLFPALLEYTQRAPREVLMREPYLVMQHIPGPTLKSVIHEVVQRGELTSRRWWRVALTMLREIASILAVVHKPSDESRDGRHCKQGYLYCDLKPDNCIVSRGNFVTLIDFGGVRDYWRESSAPAEEPWSSDPDPVFTPGYAAPEMVDPTYVGELDPRVDVYAAGALLWHMLTGESPTRAAGDLHPSPVLSADDRRLPQALPDHVRDLLRCALERDRELRFASAEKLKESTVDSLVRLGKGE